MTSASRLRMAIHTCSLYRAEIVSTTGRSGTAALVDGLEDLPCTALLPLDNNAVGRARQRDLGANVTLWLLYVFGDYAIRDGDLLVIDGDTMRYPVRDALRWDHKEIFIECIVEEPQGAVLTEEDWTR